MFWRKKKADKSSEPADDAKEKPTEPAAVTQSAIFDFGGEAAPHALYMRGLCKAAEDGGLAACQWTAEQNTSKKPVPKYYIEF